MAKYTIELRKVCNIFTRDTVESWFSSYNLSDFLTEDQIQVITNANVWSKEKLAKKIVDHYYMREIGFETPALFKHYAITTMNEIMEGYLLKIYTKFLEYDPLSSVDYTETYTRKIDTEAENNGSSNSTSNSTSETSGDSQTDTSNSSTGSLLNINSNTPQGQINKENILNGTYASSTSANEEETEIHINENNTSSSTSHNEIIDATLTSNKGNSSTIETYTHEMKGDNGVIVTNQYLVREFRELANNFDLEIIQELNTLFMGLY